MAKTNRHGSARWLIGYARISTEVHDINPQLDERRTGGRKTVLEEHTFNASRTDPYWWPAPPMLPTRRTRNDCSSHIYAQHLQQNQTILPA